MTPSMNLPTGTEQYRESLRAPDDLAASGGMRPMDSAALMESSRQQVTTRTLLVAQDDINCRRALQHYLRRSGYQVSEAGDTETALDSVFAQPTDLVILDLDLSGGTSEVLTSIRRESNVPVIVCSGRATERERVGLLNLGADDFLGKPFSFAELEARVRAVLRRGTDAPAMTLEHGDLVIDQSTRIVTVAGAEIAMTRKEFDLLAFLASEPGRVFSREDLLERVWGSNGKWQGRSTVTEHIRRVRLKIEPDPENPRWITTIRGVGYRFSSLTA